jgi:hypothetical protein
MNLLFLVALREDLYSFVLQSRASLFLSYWLPFASVPYTLYRRRLCIGVSLGDLGGRGVRQIFDVWGCPDFACPSSVLNSNRMLADAGLEPPHSAEAGPFPISLRVKVVLATAPLTFPS